MSEVRWEIVPDTRSSCTEGSLTVVGPSPTDEKCTSAVFFCVSLETEIIRITTRFTKVLTIEGFQERRESFEQRWF